MRQAGVIAAAGLVALRDMVGRLQEDHENARFLAEGLARIEKVQLDPTDVDTNMVMVDTGSLDMEAAEVAQELDNRGVKISIYGTHKIRLVTSREVNRNGVVQAIEAFADMLGQ